MTSVGTHAVRRSTRPTAEMLRQQVVCVTAGVARLRLNNGMIVKLDEADLPLVIGTLWSAVKDGNVWYARRGAKGRRAKWAQGMHSVITGVRWPRKIDHRNRNGLDNRRQNLRVSTPSQNARNSWKHVDAKHSRFKGVDRILANGKKWKWRARIQPSPAAARLFLGYFATERAAARAYDAAALQLFGEFARVNFMRRHK